jgi:hypothetical protein
MNNDKSPGNHIGYTRREGHSSATGHPAHFGVRAWQIRRLIQSRDWTGVEEGKLEVLSAWVVSLKAFRSTVIRRLGFRNSTEFREQLKTRTKPKRHSMPGKKLLTTADLIEKFGKANVGSGQGDDTVVPVMTWKKLGPASSSKTIKRINQILRGDADLTRVFREEITDNDRLETGSQLREV